MPSVPIDRPSLTPIVLNRNPTSPAACTPSLTYPASVSICILQVLPSYHIEQMPTCGFCKSASVSPMPYNIACDAPWLRGCVTREENLFRGTSTPNSQREHMSQLPTDGLDALGVGHASVVGSWRCLVLDGGWLRK